MTADNPGMPMSWTSGLEVALENLVRKLFLGGPLPTGHQEGADGQGERKKA